MLRSIRIQDITWNYKQTLIYQSNQGIAKEFNAHYALHATVVNAPSSNSSTDLKEEVVSPFVSFLRLSVW